MSEKTPLDLMVKLEERLTKNILWLFILKELKRKPMHAYAIDEILRRKYEFSIAKITPYIHLYLLEECGLVRSRKTKLKGRSAKIYSLTKEGEVILQKSLEMVKKVANMLTT